MSKLADAAKRFVLALLGSQERLSYRRLLVFGTGTALLCTHKLDEHTWLILSLTYLGTEIAEKVLCAMTGRQNADMPTLKE